MITETESDFILQKLLKEGRYYEAAFAHYYGKYAINFNHRLWLIIILSYVLSLVFLVSFNIYLLFPLTVRLPFFQYTETMYEDILHVKSMYLAFHGGKNKNDEPPLLVAKYLLQNYILVKENGSGRENEYCDTYMKNNSSYKVYNEYIKGKDAFRTNYSVVVDDIQIIEGDSLVKNALASFVLTDREDGQSSRMSVKIGFRISDVLLAHKGLVPLDFMVIDYERVRS